MYEIFGSGWDNVKGTVCAVAPPLCAVTDTFISMDSKYVNKDNQKAYMSKYPQATSWKELSHFGQEIKAGKFQ